MHTDFKSLQDYAPGELIGLKWSDIIEDTVYIKRSVNAYGETTKGKNFNAIRHFALSQLAKNVLGEQKALTPDSEYIFNIVSLSSYQKRWKRYCEQNSIPHISPYEMRHTFISIIKPLPEGQIKHLVGHSKNMDTFGVYGHEVNGEAQKTAQDINAIFTKIITDVL